MKINDASSQVLLQQFDHVGSGDIRHEPIRAFQVKDAGFDLTEGQSSCSGKPAWISRAGGSGTSGDGKFDFSARFSKMAEYGCASWAVVAWKYSIKGSEQGAAARSPCIAGHALEAFAASAADMVEHCKLPGLE